MYRTAVNLHRSRLRRLRTWHRRASAAPAPVQPDTAELAVARTDLVTALKRLPEEQRDALFLVEWFGLTSGAAAPLLGIAPGSVRSRIARARATLAIELGHDIGERSDD